MNNFKTTADGGLPLTLNDFRFIHSAIMDSFKGIMSPLGIDNQTAVILIGCTRTVALGVVTISNGYISLGGEVCYVPAHSYAVPLVGNFEYWVLNVNYNTTGTKLFKNTDTNETYEERTAKIQVSNLVPAGHTKYQDTKTFQAKINEFITAERIAQLLDFVSINDNTFTVKTGMALPFFGTTSNIPEGYLLCDGAVKLVEDFPALHAVIGYTNGGSGLNFQLPNMIDKFPMGANTSGGTGGANEFTIDNNNLPQHSHAINDPGHSHGTANWLVGGGGYNDGNDNGDGSLQANTASSGTSSASTGITETEIGGGVASPAAIDKRPAFVKQLWIIKT